MARVARSEPCPPALTPSVPQTVKRDINVAEFEFPVRLHAGRRGAPLAGQCGVFLAGQCGVFLAGQHGVLLAGQRGVLGSLFAADA